MPCDMRELGVLKLARPCSAKWSKMKGDDQVRFCALCGLDVYNLSKLTADEARALIRQREGGRLCVRFWQRADGTVITRDCPRGRFRRAWQTAAGVLAGCLAVLLVIATLFGDNLRRLFGMSTMGALVGDDAPPRDRRFDAHHPPPKDAPEWLKLRAMKVRGG
jgi:hypothetical protein